MGSEMCIRDSVKGVANTLADGISRWERDNVNRHLREYRPDIDWQERPVYGDIGIQYIRGSVADSCQRTYVSYFRSWIKFRGLTSAALYFSGDTPLSDMVWALVDFAAWCCAAEGNKVGTIKSTIATVQYFHRVEVDIEPPTKSPLLERVISGISRAHAVAGTKSRVRRPMSRDMLLERETLVPS